ncbi:mycofactocin biosynthesis glycosyltransferase MftF [Skermania piniformis]|uniref:Mycofactocin biosynthesis glycosyltransferase MftF n=1 Tax=Skermania pinensis TaxID=39122 RepID=A0ABX8SDK7_9ACTN|nr:mycofactocin biosynthesis glycosyltransferase MftF [Skermania piniformis]QXQ14520.1 mycofactocin biosynthesis glycosyltransferase MftF [Skermania piniformis]
MQQGRLPDGFGVRIDPTIRSYSGGRVLLGGSPARVLRLPESAVELIGDGFLEVTDSRSAGVARRLLDSGVGNPRPRLLPSTDAVTIVVPLRNNRAGLDRLLAGLRGHHVVVVDDGSDTPVALPACTPSGCRVTVLRLDRPVGPAAARNAGLRLAPTEFVAFLDADVAPRHGWLEIMLGHFSDPSVALVAPRIVVRALETSALARYEHSRSPLDLGRHEAAVRAGGRVSHAPGEAILVRRRALLEIGGFDESLRVAADIDLSWRLDAAGWILRYEPAAQVAYNRRVGFVGWLGRIRDDGTGAAPLGIRHPGAVRPLVMSRWAIAGAILLATLSRFGVVGALGTFVVTVIRMRAALAEVDRSTRIAALYAAHGFGVGLWQLASVLCRHYWPVTLLAMLCSARVRQLMFVVAAVAGGADWYAHREPGGLGAVRYVALKRLDDVAYGAGLWDGVIRARSLEALKPAIGE